LAANQRERRESVISWLAFIRIEIRGKDFFICVYL